MGKVQFLLLVLDSIGGFVKIVVSRRVDVEIEAGNEASVGSGEIIDAILRGP